MVGARRAVLLLDYINMEFCRGLIIFHKNLWKDFGSGGVKKNWAKKVFSKTFFAQGGSLLLFSAFLLH
ncbi:MAG: hypothetical protein A3E19_01715 [Planctomycetes bacterium RIFCSPHIGHO2_12_FULL_52_36]|nr:MAG: hypothetical protein A3D89_03175 [Planctomycetes bacterium RIFCSPHIGHO2_02_FULL_52_58]OHB94215.1 MAG: hypothetical protein A3E19_01715 [Planctomycetes bacterium RIFCSPHIGHO2_12_FULL_52_36]